MTALFALSRRLVICSKAMSYRFCNDKVCFINLDKKVSELLQNYLQTYRSIQKAMGEASTWELLGIQSLERAESPFSGRSSVQSHRKLRNRGQTGRTQIIW